MAIVASAPVVPSAEIGLVAAGLDHPEDVVWDPDRRLLYAGGEAGQLYVVDDGAVEQVADLGVFVAGLALDAEGRVYACAGPEVRRVTPATGRVETYSEGAPSRPIVLSNYPAFAADGTLYFTDSGRWGEACGAIFRVAPDGRTEVWSEALAAFPNGCALTPQGDALVVVQSGDPGVWWVPIGADGAAGRPEALCRLPGTVPDGVAFDRDGRLLIACYQPNRVHRLAGEALEVLAEDPLGMVLAMPSNVAFMGDDLGTIAVSSVGGTAIRRIDADVPGLALHRPVVAA